MKVVYNSFIPFEGYKAMTVLWFIFCRHGVKLNEVDINHETIHWEQQKELLVVFFYLWYVIEWTIRFIITFDNHKAYKSISFEREAYAYESNRCYLKVRKRYSWMKYLF